MHSCIDVYFYAWTRKDVLKLFWSVWYDKNMVDGNLVH